jgi:hypothetical protein
VCCCSSMAMRASGSIPACKVVWCTLFKMHNSLLATSPTKLSCEPHLCVAAAAWPCAPPAACAGCRCWQHRQCPGSQSRHCPAWPCNQSNNLTMSSKRGQPLRRSSIALQQQHNPQHPAEGRTDGNNATSTTSTQPQTAQLLSWQLPADLRFAHPRGFQNAFNICANMDSQLT